MIIDASNLENPTPKGCQNMTTAMSSLRDCPWLLQSPLTNYWFYSNLEREYRELTNFNSRHFHIFPDSKKV
jgi:hypothetical protein